MERSDANAKAYGYNVTAKQLLSGSIEVPEWADAVHASISKRAGSLDANWVNDSPMNSPTVDGRERGYSFGSASSAVGSSPNINKSSKSPTSNRFSSIGNRFSPKLSRSNSNKNHFDADFGDTYGRIDASDEDDDGTRGTWAADKGKKAKPTRRPSSPRSSLDSLEDEPAPAPQSKRRDTGTRSRSGTLLASSQSRQPSAAEEYVTSSKKAKTPTKILRDIDPFVDQEPANLMSFDYQDPPRSSIDSARGFSDGYSTDEPTSPKQFVFKGAVMEQSKANLRPGVKRTDTSELGKMATLSIKSAGRAIAMYDFAGAEAGDLSFGEFY